MCAGTKRDEVLSGLDSRRRAAFAAAVAERLFYAYDLHTRSTLRESRTVRQGLDHLWKALQAGGACDPTIRRTLMACEAQLAIEAPYDHGAYAALGEFALAATIYALRAFCTDDRANAAWASDQGLDAADCVAGMSIHLTFGPEAERALKTHPAVVTEVATQLADLRELQAAPVEQAIRRVRARARTRRRWIHPRARQRGAVGPEARAFH